jgi:hypothetical protein
MRWASTTVIAGDVPGQMYQALVRAMHALYEVEPLRG